MACEDELPPHYPERLGDLKLRPIGRIDHLGRLAVRYRMNTLCESPIEIEFGVAFHWLAEDRFVIDPQFWIERFRYDFVIRKLEGRPILLVECDGKEFHSTSEQLDNDARKDALAQNHGLLVYRLSGATINRSVNAAAQSVLNFCVEHHGT